MGARSAFVKVNSDPDYRAKFLKDPIATLKAEGIQLSAQDQAQLLDTIKSIKANFPHLADLPAGYDMVINAVDGKKAARKTGDPGPMII